MKQGLLLVLLCLCFAPSHAAFQYWTHNTNGSKCHKGVLTDTAVVWLEVGTPSGTYSSLDGSPFSALMSPGDTFTVAIYAKYFTVAGTKSPVGMEFFYTLPADITLVTTSYNNPSFISSSSVCTQQNIPTTAPLHSFQTGYFAAWPANTNTLVGTMTFKLSNAAANFPIPFSLGPGTATSSSTAADGIVWLTACNNGNSEYLYAETIGGVDVRKAASFSIEKPGMVFKLRPTYCFTAFFLSSSTGTISSGEVEKTFTVTLKMKASVSVIALSGNIAYTSPVSMTSSGMSVVYFNHAVGTGGTCPSSLTLSPTTFTVGGDTPAAANTEGKSKQIPSLTI